MFKLISYKEPESGERYGSQRLAMFGKKLDADFRKNRFYYQSLAEQDALNDALAFQKNGFKPTSEGLQMVRLKEGSNPKAEECIINVLKVYDVHFPDYEGIKINREGKTLTMLSIEGERSYSGVLSFRCYNTKGKQTMYFKIKVDGDNVKVLDGKLPKE